MYNAHACIYTPCTCIIHCDLGRSHMRRLHTDTALTNVCVNIFMHRDVFSMNSLRHYIYTTHRHNLSTPTDHTHSYIVHATCTIRGQMYTQCTVQIHAHVHVKYMRLHARECLLHTYTDYKQAYLLPAQDIKY